MSVLSKAWDAAGRYRVLVGGPPPPALSRPDEAAARAHLENCEAGRLRLRAKRASSACPSPESVAALLQRRRDLKRRPGLRL